MRNYLKKTYMGIASLLALMSCSDGNDIHTYTVGAEDNAIALSIGVDNSPLTPTPNLAKTRAAEGDNYIPLAQGTKMRLRVEGKWNDSELIKFTDCSADAATGNNTYNTISSYSPMLYWDDFGTADPNNTTGKTDGLAIYGVAVDGMTTAPNVNNTNSDNGTIESDQWGDHSSEDNNLLSWSTEDNSTSTVLERDLMVSNNLSKTTAETPGNLTFEEHKAINKNLENKDEKQSRLIFKHVLSKFTFNLKAADGFENYTFKSNPTVTLTRKKASEMTEQDNAAYCLVDGNINIKKGEAKANESNKKVIKAKYISGQMDNGYQVVTEAAIVYPGTQISSSENDIIAQINADGNIYYITSEAIRTAINAISEHNNDFKAKAGYNYVFNITVKKTKINVTASVEQWNVVTADYEPKIDVTGNIGDGNTSASSLNSFSLYLKDDDNGQYGLSGSETFIKANSEITVNTTGSNTTYTFSPKVYWPDHQTHYHFRAVYPKTKSTSDGSDPEVVTKSGTQAIKVNNCKYEESKYPCNLLIGAPEITEGTMCGNKDHISPTTEVDMSEHGICAREGSINLNFRYMMSQVVVNLSTSADGASNKVNIGANTIVEIENANTEGWIGLHNRNVVKYGDNTSTYKMNNDEDKSRHDAIIPQNIENLVFKISVSNDNNVTDIYRANIKDIPVYVTDSSGNKTGEAKHITSWDSGHKYIYNLKVTKTKVSITATITDWETRSTDETDIWL